MAGRTETPTADNTPVIFAPIPSTPLSFDTLHLFFRKQGKKAFIEATSPGGERVEVPTKIDWKTDPDGIALGKALLPEPILQLHTKLLQQAASKGRGLRLQLDFPGTAAELAHFPWEKACIGTQPILSKPQMTISRTVASPIPALPFEASQQPYRILMVLANPLSLKTANTEQKLSSLNLIEDYNRVEAAVRPLVDQGLLELILLKEEEATLEKVRSIIQQKEIHCLFYSGNGTIGHPDTDTKEEQDGYLLFDGPKREGSIYTGNEIIQKVGLSREKTSIRLIILNACHTAYGKNGGEGVAEAFLRAGIPAVVAFNSIVYDEQASNFSGAFFSALIEKNSLELAMYAGRKAIAETSGQSETTWSDPILFSRVRDGKKVFAGELIGKVATYVNVRGDLEVVEQQEHQSVTDLFNQQLKNLTSRLALVKDSEKYVEAQNLVIKATRELGQNNGDEAINLLSEASLLVAKSLKEETAARMKAEAEAAAKKEAVEQKNTVLRKLIRQRSIVLGMATVMFVLIGVLDRFCDPTSEIGVIGLPLPVVLWSLVGGVGATLYAFVGTQKYMENEPLRLDWLVGRPLVGVIMGCVVYLTVATSISALTTTGTLNDGNPTTTITSNTPEANPTQPEKTIPSPPEPYPKPYLLWALTFLGGFSDKFAILLFSNLVGKYTSGKKEEDEPANPSSAGAPPGEQGAASAENQSNNSATEATTQEQKTETTS